MKKLILSASILAVTLALVVGGTTAFFSDTETSSGNTFSAGDIDLKIDNTSYYSAMDGIYNAATSWLAKDLTTGDMFFNFLDLKPGDWGEDTISLHVGSNPAWACMEIDLTSDDDNGLTEPESEVDTTGGAGEGELDENIRFVWWGDDGDNVLETDESESVFFQNLLGNLDGFKVPLADSSGEGVLGVEPLAADSVHYIGKAWCFGDFTLGPVAQDGFGFTQAVGGNGPDVRNSGIVCDGSELDNSTQTDSVTGDITFTATQSRHLENFRCQDGGGVGCNDKADVMLVLDRSGSIDAGEMASLKTAAHAFVTAMTPTASGTHMGQTSFSTTGSLDLALTGDATAINNAIDAVTQGGTTNLFDGITLATAELGGANDRPDGEAPDFMVVITDGNPNEPGSDANAELVAAQAADAARAAGIQVYVVGVGNDVDSIYLINNIANSPAHYFAVSDYSNLTATLNAIANCEQPPQTTGQLTVTKQVINDNNGTKQVSDFPLFVNGFEVVSGVSINLPAGNYTLTEGNNAGYTTTFSGDCDVNGNVSLGVGDVKSCTMINNDVAPVAIFSDSFGDSTSDTNDIPNWDENGTDSGATTLARAAQGSGEDIASPDGAQFAKIADGDWICRSVPAGYNTLSLSYYWKGDPHGETFNPPGGDGGPDNGRVQYKSSGTCTGGGGTWTSVDTHPLDAGDNDVDEGWSSLLTANLPNGATLVRFLNDSSDGSDNNEFFRVDGVTLTGIPN